ncbi:TOBE domain protein [Arcobacter nitrofigilis DSM 7299]|uniref:TOBE domain protein n=1 Tax=Arcobacter nitrofigilis (strain ATCC 33309 / DSM 7299 / CCUG 15893 / LMG 7604 / NCTC 12251 / CI) TaxID=572480 RepID=D5V3J7_ARCNC|nr:TOBE domain-containing protein [Arcobacter nitrofigilis]ADG91708.1 TOBE domain protein [Arcobacter nitrofigilis DSM 7299]
MKTSARNQLSGKVVEITTGTVMSEIKIEVSPSIHICATVTNDGKESLGIDVDSKVGTLIKASTIILSKETIKTTARNNIKGVVKEVIKGAVNSEIKVSIGENQLCAVVTNEAVEDLSIKKDDTVYAIFKASSVILVA